jgi:hypothetical protein
MKKQRLFVTLLILPFFLLAQSERPLSEDKAFFKEKRMDYQKWLDSSGIGKVLRTQTVYFPKPEVISLDLVFYTENVDSVAVLWQALKRDFQKQDRGLTLEEELFYKMLYFMEIKPTQGYVQIFDTYNPIKQVCFRRSIAFEKNKVYVDSAGCKSKYVEFTVEPNNLSNLRSASKIDFNKKPSKEIVFAKIKTYVEKRFNRKQEENRSPKVDWINETNTELVFRVQDLTKEVLIDETNPWWCSVLTPMCTSCQNCKKRELLDMRIGYSETPTGYRISLNIDAKFASGWYNEVKRGGYKNMELDYKRYVEEYATRFKKDLFEELKK